MSGLLVEGVIGGAISMTSCTVGLAKPRDMRGDYHAGSEPAVAIDADLAALMQARALRRGARAKLASELGERRRGPDPLARPRRRELTRRPAEGVPYGDRSPA